MRQSVGIAQALLNDPDVLVVDEPTVGLDPEKRVQIRNLLSSVASDRVVLLSTHIVPDIEATANRASCTRLTTLGSPEPSSVRTGPRTQTNWTQTLPIRSRMGHSLRPSSEQCRIR